MKDEVKYNEHIESGDIVEHVCMMCGNFVAFIPNPHILEEKLTELLDLVIERNHELIKAPCNNPKPEEWENYKETDELRQQISNKS